MARPIELWQPRHQRGRPGYSGRGLDAVSPPAETPLSVAATIADNLIHEAVGSEARARRDGGEDVEANLRWLSDQLNHRKADKWQELCDSIDCVIAMLESSPHAKRPGFKRLIACAKRAQRTGRA